MPKRSRIYRRPVQEFPPDFPVRMERLKEAGGLSWRQFALRLGADLSTVWRWRNGQQPNAAYLFALFSMARNIPEGSEILFESLEPVES